jgi:hypothetical protein
MRFRDARMWRGFLFSSLKLNDSLRGSSLSDWRAAGEARRASFHRESA